jgi:acetyl esterase
VLTAEYDPLRDQGRAYAERLAAEGTPADVRNYDGLFHGFFGMHDTIEPARAAFDDAVAFLRRVLAVDGVRS